jgi:hypothetical protein
MAGVDWSGFAPTTPGVSYKELIVRGGARATPTRESTGPEIWLDIVTRSLRLAYGSGNRCSAARPEVLPQHPIERPHHTLSCFPDTVAVTPLQSYVCRVKVDTSPSPPPESTTVGAYLGEWIARVPAVAVRTRG